MPICAKQKPEYFEFASQQLDETFVHGPSCKCLASLASDGRIMAVVVFDHINDINCMMHVASDGSRRFITREFLAWTFRYPFMQLNLRRVTGLVRADNARALAFDRGLGFVQEGLVRHAFGDVDGILFGMLKEECRHLTIEVK